MRNARNSTYVITWPERRQHHQHLHHLRRRRHDTSAHTTLHHTTVVGLGWLGTQLQRLKMVHCTSLVVIRPSSATILFRHALVISCVSTCMFTCTPRIRRSPRFPSNRIGSTLVCDTQKNGGLYLYFTSSRTGHILNRIVGALIQPHFLWETKHPTRARIYKCPTHVKLDSA